MFEKLDYIEEKYERLNDIMSDPAVLANPAELQKHARTHSELSEIVDVYRRYKKIIEEIKESKALQEIEQDKDMREMISSELSALEEEKTELDARLKILLLPKDPNDEKNVIMEVRAGTGGEEAGLFAADLYKMYTRYAENQGWKTELMSANYTDIGGFKEISFLIEGRGAYSKLKFESGVHRVQRVPSTESSGRIHTSAATVAVLPEAEDVDIHIDPNDVRVDVFCSSGPGGQSVNTTQSAVRLTHIPTGMVVSCQDEKSQHKNKDKAMKVLRSRLLEKMQEEKDGEMAANRKSQVGSGDRSERIRTYNFPQGRVTDHRVGLTLHKLDNILLGDIEEIIMTLITADQAEKLKQLE